jgi:hypothetical protein
MGIMQQLVVDVQLHSGQRRLMLPFGRSQIDLRARRFHLDEASLAQVRKLTAQATQPAASASQKTYQIATVEQSAALEASAPLEGVPVVAVPASAPPVVQSPPVQTVPTRPAPYIAQPQPIASTPSVTPTVYSQAPTNDVTTEYVDEYDDVVEEETIPLLEERLIVNRERQKRGEVVVRKEIETEIVEVPVQREKLIVEEVGPTPKQLAEIDLHEDEPPIPGSETRQVKRSQRRRQ